MAQKLDWNKVNDSQTRTAKGGGPLGQIQRLTLGKKAVGKKYIVRPLGSPVGFYQAYIEDGHGGGRYVNIDIDQNGGDSLVKAHPLSIQHNVEFKVKYAINVLDREDNQVKILQCGTSIFQVFKQYQVMTGNNPGGKDGADFEIYVSGQKGAGYYVTTFKVKSPIKEQDRQALKNSLYNLESIFKATPQEKWQQIVANLGAAPVAPTAHIGQRQAAPVHAARPAPALAKPSAPIAPSQDQIGF